MSDLRPFLQSTWHACCRRARRPVEGVLVDPALAARIACNPPLALRYMKEGLRRAAYGDPRELGGWAIETIRTLMKTEDHREGVASFLEKRPPVFTGR